MTAVSNELSACFQGQTETMIHPRPPYLHKLPDRSFCSLSLFVDVTQFGHYVHFGGKVVQSDKVHNRDKMTKYPNDHRYRYDHRIAQMCLSQN